MKFQQSSKTETPPLSRLITFPYHQELAKPPAIADKIILPCQTALEELAATALAAVNSQ